MSLSDIGMRADLPEISDNGNLSDKENLMVKTCVHCGSENLEYWGLDDGGGPYGESIEQLWNCVDCGFKTAEVVKLVDDDDNEQFKAMQDYGLLS